MRCDEEAMTNKVIDRVSRAPCMVSTDILEGEGAEIGEQSFVLAKSLVTPHLAVGDSDVMFRLVLVKSILCRVRVESGLNFIFLGGGPA